MDLDNLKKVWNENQTSLPSVSDDKLLSMLKGKGKTALYKLYIWELISAIIFLPLAVFPFIESKFSAFLQYSKFCEYLFCIFCVFGFFWQLYKIMILKRVDLKNNTIITSSKYICRYKLCINIEVFISLTFILVFMAILLYSIQDIFPKEMYIIMFVWIVLMVILMWYIYKKFYRKQIKLIEQSIIEIQYFEKDNL